MGGIPTTWASRALAEVARSFAALEVPATFGLFPPWEHIDTAPKDGTAVLLYEGFEPAIQSGYFAANDGEWRRSSCGSVPFWREPKHWMPLPGAPE